MAQPRWFIYMLRCRDGSLYTGIALDVARRVREHRSGKGSKYVRSRLPVRLVYREECASRSKALKREAAIKQWPREQKVRYLKEIS